MRKDSDGGDSRPAELHMRGALFDPSAPPRERRPLRAPEPSVHHFTTSDGVQLRLTRYSGGSKGPVVLCHGLGVSSGIFSLDTIETNLVEYLTSHEYDVWLLDFRASIELPHTGSQETADTMAAIDYPEAVDEVLRVTGASSVQMVVHCFGSTVFFMSILSGALPQVRSAVASQATPHIDPAVMVDLKVGLHFPRVLEALGVDTLDAYTDTDANWVNRLYNSALKMYPHQQEEQCDSAVCHRISFMYSTLYEHDQLSDATHDTLHELFGVANITSFQHIGQIARTGHIVDFDGGEAYMPNVERLAIPLLLIHGAENACFKPSGSERTLEWLQGANDPGLYSRKLIPRYGHIDCIFGKNAATDVYPHIVEHLETTAHSG